VLFAACGDDSTTTSETTTTAGPGGGETTTTGAPELTDSFRGVTAESIKVGIILIDYTSEDCISTFIDFSRGDQQAVAQAFVDDINDNGGVGGRSIDPVYATYCPIDSADAVALCTTLTDDEQVFAALGVMIAPEGQLCLSRDHETIHIGHEMTKETIDQAPPGLLLTPDITAERRINVLMNLVAQESFLEGQKVAILADQDTESIANDVITPALTDLGLEQGSTAVLTIEGTDTSAAQAQLDSFIERWQSENVTAVVMSGLDVSSKQFVEKLRAAMPDLQLLTDTPSSVGEAAQDEVTAGVSPNPYEAVVSADGETSSERWANSAALQRCVDVYEAASGETVVGPDELQPGADGKRVELYIAVTDFCNELTFFKNVAEAVGPDLTNESWTEAVNSFGPIDLVSTDIASLGEGKYDADDAFRLVQFDSTIGHKGDWKPITEIEDASGS